MTTSTSTPSSRPGGRPRPVPRRVTVRAVDILSPRMRRITFEGADLATFAWSGPAAHIKLIPPEPGSDVAPVPTPDGPRPTTMRTYTPRRFDAQAQTLTVDFVLHGEGPAATWAAAAMPGQQLTIMGPGRGYALDADADWYVLACDQTALPAVETILDALPSMMPVTVFVEADAVTETRPLAGAPAVDVRWLVRGADGGPGSALEAALASFAWPSGAGRVYVGCESNAMRRLRSLIIERSGLGSDRVVARGYWRVGVGNHPDHDYAE